MWTSRLWGLVLLLIPVGFALYAFRSSRGTKPSGNSTDDPDANITWSGGGSGDTHDQSSGGSDGHH
jgi:hypothetical protein